MRILFTIGLVLMLISFGFSQDIRQKINQGNSHYYDQEYDRALNQYQDALLEDPRNDIAHFNQGDALYKQKKYDKAIEAYQKVLGTEDLMLESKSYYNIGNAYFLQDKLQESIESYMRALDINPDDRDAKYNLELARAKLKELSEKQQQQPQQNQQQQGQQQNQQGQGNEDNGRDQEQALSQEEQQGVQPAEEQQGEEQNQNQTLEETKDQLSKEDAQRILDALENDEKEAQKLRRPRSTQKRRVEKDW